MNYCLKPILTPAIGFERLVALLQKKNSAYETDIFEEIIKK